MASSKVMSSSSKSRKSDLSRRSSSVSSTKLQSILATITNSNTATTTTTAAADSATGDRNLASMTVDGIFHNIYDTNPSTESTLLDAQITLMDTQTAAIASIDGGIGNNPNGQLSSRTADDVWREIVSGGNCNNRNQSELKVEETDVMMTLEDFLAKAGAVDEDEIKIPAPLTETLSGGVFNFDPMPLSSLHSLDKVEGSIIGFGNGVEMTGGVVSGDGSGAGGARGKRGRQVLEQLDKAALQRQKRMIKNRESAARSRERKQAYQVELESLAVRLEEENAQLMKEKAEKTKKRFDQLMENVIPVVEKRKPPHVLRRVRSMQW